MRCKKFLYAKFTNHHTRESEYNYYRIMSFQQLLNVFMSLLKSIALHIERPCHCCKFTLT